jgi:glycosyltransferase involved in cell wall biosynthesis
MPMALESFDLRSYDLVISSESGPAKGVLTSSVTRHICYCHTPMRYLWELYPAYLSEFRRGIVAPALFAPIASYLRTWDYGTAARVDGFMANSQNVRHRIWKTYRRKSSVVYPPIPVEGFRYSPHDDYFLVVSEMVPYKRLDYLVRLFAQNGRKLKMVGQGPEFINLKRLATKNIEFCGRVSDTELRDLYAGCAALLMPGEEDFGMTMVESLASGKPVIALGCGGAMEVVANGCGILYSSPTEAGLEEALRTFDRVASFLDPVHMQLRALEFSEVAFERNFRKALQRHGAGNVPRGDSAHPINGQPASIKQPRLSAIELPGRA